MSERRSVLIINDEWGTSKGGISTVHRQVAGLATDAGLQVYTPVLCATQADKDDAKQKNITLIEPRVKDGLSDTYKKPRLDWLLCHETFYPGLKERIPYPHIIIGHAPVTTDAAIDMKDRLFPESKLFLFNHVISEDIELHKPSWSPERVDEREKHALNAAKKADVIFSVGPRMFDHFSNKFRALPADDDAEHEQFIPIPDDSFFKTEIRKSEVVKRKQVITFGRISGVEKLKGYDVVAAAMSKVADAFEAMSVPVPTWVVRGVPEGEGVKTREILDKYVTSKHLQYNLYPYGTQDEIRQDLQQSHLCIMASKTEPFGLVGFEAMATGIPVLVTKNAGLADFIQEQFPTLAESVIVNVGVNDVHRDYDIKEWDKSIRRVLNHYPAALKRAKQLKESLKDCEAVTTSEETFKRYLCK